MLLDYLVFGLVVLFILIGLVGVVVPVLPGVLLIWLAVLFYAWYDGFAQMTPWLFAFISLIALVTGTADIWMSLLGAKTGGASSRSMVYGVVGALLGFALGSLVIIGGLVGALAGYMGGILWSEYRKHEDWSLAWKAALGGLAGWGVATAVQLGGGLLILLLFLGRLYGFF
jgi:uncharacterized protein